MLSFGKDCYELAGYGTTMQSVRYHLGEIPTGRKPDQLASEANPSRTQTTILG